ncbi:MAG: protein kinase, partial [Myxococcales bacterium]|nr:protein kinase [Myxococcales bacterium]
MDAATLGAVLLEGRYRYVRELGRGGAGRVVLAQDVVGGGERALKIVAAEARGMLELELDLLRRVAHPSLARVYELLYLTSATPAPFHLPGEAAVLVQEHVEGRASDEALEAFEPGEEARWRLALRAALDVASALAALHELGVVHGDVSPSNVLVRTREDEATFATLIDLGLAGPPLAADGRVRGTPGYLAPEAATGVRSVGTDLFGLGATLHRWLVGGSPRTITGDPWLGGPSIDGESFAGAPEVPAALRDVVADLLALDPAERPRSATEAWESLARVAEAFGVARSSASLSSSSTSSSSSTRGRGLAALHAPWIGDVERLEAAARALDERAGPFAGVLIVSGPRASGKTRFAREVTARLQARRRARGEAVPTFVIAQGELPRFDARAAAVLARGVDDAELVAYVRAEALAGLERFVIGERAARDEAVHDEAVRDGALHAEAVRDEAVRDEAVRDEAVRDEAVRDEAVRDEA